MFWDMLRSLFALICYIHRLGSIIYTLFTLYIVWVNFSLTDQLSPASRTASGNVMLVWLLSSSLSVSLRICLSLSLCKNASCLSSLWFLDGMKTHTNTHIAYIPHFALTSKLNILILQETSVVLLGIKRQEATKDL